MSKKPLLLSNIAEIMTMEGALRAEARGAMTVEHLSLKKKQSLVISDGKIVWMGAKNKLPKKYFTAREKKIEGNVFPGFVECHTHSLFYGNRKNEFELRNQGVSYQEIAQRGGGIHSTVTATRSASVKQLSKKLNQHLDQFLKQGVTVVEVKTGYGLGDKEELRLLEVIRKTKASLKVIPTFLGAHAIPKDTTASAYLNQLSAVLPIIKKKKLSNRVDIFIEKGYFSLPESESYLREARQLGFDICMHADQLTRTGGAALAASLGAVSTDHNVCVNAEDIATLAASETTSVLLPNADFYIHCPYPPARELIEAGARVALSTDYNPGTSPSQSVQLVGVLARLKMKMSLPEVFAAWTVGAAYALNLQNEQGALLPAYNADFFVSDASWDDFFYDFHQPVIKQVWVAGKQKV